MPTLLYTTWNWPRILPVATVGLILLSTLSGCFSRELGGRKVPDKEPKEIPALINGGSMVPTLLGAHYEIECEDCKYLLHVDAEHLPKNRMAVCQNCGWDQNQFQSQDLKSAQTVKVLPASSGRKFKRWEVVAIKHPEHPDQFAVKRIVGLPNEKIRIEAGEVWADETLIRKDFNEQKQLSITIYDSNFAPAKDGPIRWKGGDSESLSNGELHLVEDRWVDYQNIRGYRGRGKPRDLRPVEDYYGFNQTTVRSLNWVQDLAIEFTVPDLDKKNLSVRFNHLSKPLVVTLNGSSTTDQNTGNVLVNGEQRATFKIKKNAKIYCSIYDQQILLAVDGEQVFRKPLSLELATESVSAPISVSGTDVSLRDITISRDIMWLAYKNDAGGWETAGDGYLLLGDNVPISQDSRHWQNKRIKHSEVIGSIQD